MYITIINMIAMYINPQLRFDMYISLLKTYYNENVLVLTNDDVP